MTEQHSSMRRHGRIEQQQRGFTAVRIRTVGGHMTSDQLRKVADLAEAYGRGQLHITTRQSVEIHWVEENRLNSIFQEIHNSGLLLAVRGARIMTVVACPGIKLCRKGIGDTAMLAIQLNASVVGREMAGKTKIAVSGCPSSCAKPQINDIGLHGVIIPAVAGGCAGCNACIKACKVEAIQVRESGPDIDRERCIGCGSCVRNCPQQALIAGRQGYAVYAGGKIGKRPMLGVKLLSAVPEQDAAAYIQVMLDVYQRLGLKGERIGEMMKRIGAANFQQEVSKLFSAK